MANECISQDLEYDLSPRLLLLPNQLRSQYHNRGNHVHELLCSLRQLSISGNQNFCQTISLIKHDEQFDDLHGILLARADLRVHLTCNMISSQKNESMALELVGHLLAWKHGAVPPECSQVKRPISGLQEHRSTAFCSLQASDLPGA